MADTLQTPTLPPGFAGVNGRIEAKQVDIATKYPGRIKEVLADEGDTVDEGQVVATMDTEPLEAQLRNAEAKIREAEDIGVRRSPSHGQEGRVNLLRQTVQTFEGTGRTWRGKRAGNGYRSCAHGDIQAALLGAQAQAVSTQSAIDAATAEAERIKAEIKDSC